MANKKISAMTGAAALTGAEVVPGVQSAANVKITTSAFGVGVGTDTAVAGAATVNKPNGIVTSEALTGATTYTLTLTNSFVKTTSVVLVNVRDSAATNVIVSSVTPASGSVVIVVTMAALTGTLVFAFGVMN